MTTIGKRGLGQRHSFTPINQSPKELRERELRDARRTIEKLEHRCGALESTIKTINRLAQPYAIKRDDRSR